MGDGKSRKGDFFSDFSGKFCGKHGKPWFCDSAHHPSSNPVNVKDATELHRLCVTVTSMRSRDSHNVVVCGAEFARFYMGRLVNVSEQCKGLCSLSKGTKRDGFVAFSTTTTTTPHYTPIHYNYNFTFTFTTF